MDLLNIALDTTMGEILDAYPSAKVGLFQSFHIGGCDSCGYKPTDTVAEVIKAQNLTATIDEMVVCIRNSTEVESKLHTNVADVVAALAAGSPLTLLDVRSPEEYEKGHIEGAKLLTVNLTFEILDGPDKDAPLVLYSDQGTRSMSKASYFTAYGMKQAKSLDGGLAAWTTNSGAITTG